VLVLMLLVGLPAVALGLFALARGVAAPVVFAFLLLGAGTMLFGAAETVSLGPRWTTVAGRLVGLLAFPGFLVVTLISA
jgi:hypothetical protein